MFEHVPAQDGIAFDSHTMNRVRKVMDESLAVRPGARLIDMHSGNPFAEAANSSNYPDYSFPAILNQTCATGCVSAALCYMQHMPFIDSTMFGEAFGARTPDRKNIAWFNVP